MKRKRIGAEMKTMKAGETSETLDHLKTAAIVLTNAFLEMIVLAIRLVDVLVGVLSLGGGRRRTPARFPFRRRRRYPYF